MSAHSESTHRLYFGYRPAARHQPGCSRQGTGLAEVTVAVQEDIPGKVTGETYRFACGECGEAVFVFADGELEAERVPAFEIGFGSVPERAGSLWLHPGPRLLATDATPWEYLVTLNRARPLDPGDVVGKIRSVPGRRGGIRWSAGTGYTELGLVENRAGENFRSKRVAAAWIEAELAREGS